jgi:hypothetical protein
MTSGKRERGNCRAAGEARALRRLAWSRARRASGNRATCCSASTKPLTARFCEGRRTVAGRLCEHVGAVGAITAQQLKRSCPLCLEC